MLKIRHGGPALSIQHKHFVSVATLAVSLESAASMREVKIMSSVASAVVRERDAPLVKGRQPRKFTLENIARIKDWVTQGVGRDEIANRLEVTVGSLQVTCSKLGVSLRRSALAESNGGIQPLGLVQRSIEHIRQGDHAAQAKLTLLLQTKNRQAAFDLPLHRDLIEQLALEASVRGQTIADLLGTILKQVMERELVGEILRAA